MFLSKVLPYVDFGRINVVPSIACVARIVPSSTDSLKDLSVVSKIEGIMVASMDGQSIELSRLIRPPVLLRRKTSLKSTESSTQSRLLTR